MHGKVIQIVQPVVCEELLDVLEHLRIEILAGRCVGLAWVEMEKIDKYSVDAAGACRNFPAAARGMADDLCDALAELNIAPRQG